MKVLATDLDKTLLPNGIAPYDGSMSLLHELVQKHDISLIFVTARRVRSVLTSVMEQFGPPEAVYIIGAVGAEMYERNSSGEYVEITAWRDYILKEAPLWDLYAIDALIVACFPHLELQPEKELTAFKRSYFLRDLSRFEEVDRALKKLMSQHFGDSVLVTCSKDLNANLAYVDVTPGVVSKISALSFLLKQASIPQESVLFGGDSENDLSVFLSSLDSVIVANAERELVGHVKSLKQRGGLFVAEGVGGLNGNYSSGLIEGMIKKGWISPEDCSNFTAL